MRLPVLFFLLLITIASCQRKKLPENPAVWQKVRIDFRKIDSDGLTGPASGKVAVNYEFCIPSREENWKAVRNIDPTAQRQTGSKGRIGCQKDQWLVVGSTHQKGYQRVLYRLASLSYVARIQETFWE